MNILGREIHADQEQILGFAMSKGYEPTKTVDITEEMEVEQAHINGYSIKEVLEDTTKCIAITGTEEVENSQTYIEFIEEHYYTPILADIKEFLKVQARVEIEAKRKLEDEAIDAQVEQLTNNII